MTLGRAAVFRKIVPKTVEGCLSTPKTACL